MEQFFTKDKNFYKTFFRLMVVVALQNLVAYSVNMLDNMMLGSYSQSALSGAATVNQLFFIVNQLALAIGNALIVMSSQCWGKRDTRTIKKLTGISLTFSVLAAFVWKVPVEWVVVAVQSDQLFKCVPVFLRFRSYKWIRKLA